MRHIVLALAVLAGCAAEEAAPVVTPDAPSAYGPDNNWFHAQSDEVPAASEAGSQFVQGKLAPNFTLVDQYNDPVELYQFAGKLVLLEVMPDHGTLVETLVEGECVG